MEARLVGQTFADRYDVLELLGAGGMGEVYRARDRELDELVALKVLRTELASDPDFVARFRHEVKLARRVTHTNVARTFELGTADGIMFCTMELIDGESLTRRLATSRKLSVAEATAIASAVCAGLTAAHGADVIHRDIKPDNVLLARDGRVIVADFGVASARASGHGDLSGTPAYMAPEQARGESTTPASDVYAVGVLLYEMLSGRRGFSGDVATILSAKQTTERLTLGPGEIPDELAEVIARATERDLAARYPTADTLRRALAPWARIARSLTDPASLPHRNAIEASELHQLFVLAPREAPGTDLAYLAESVYGSLLTKLSRRPRLRVQPRASAPAQPEAIVISLSVDSDLELAMTRDGVELLSTRFPLAVDQVEVAADAAAAAITARLLVDDPRRADPAWPAIDLMLRAQSIVQRDFSRMPEVLAMLDQAAALAPHNPRIAATIAIVQVRQAFFTVNGSPPSLARAVSLARAAVAVAPELVESHLAMGHVELQTGDCALAAAHFRRAIACSPLNAEAHEFLARLLLEAGFLEPGLARLTEAIAIAPHRRAARWEVARIHALNAEWDEHARILAELGEGDHARAFARARYMWWRGEYEASRPLRDPSRRSRAFQPFVDHLFAVFCDGEWEQRRDVIIALCRDTHTTVRRLRSFAAQVFAEAAGWSGDVASCNLLITIAVDAGLFDLYWLDRCVLLECARGTAAFQALRAVVKTRSDAILDALYGDHQIAGDSETALAPSALVSLK